MGWEIRTGRGVQRTPYQSHTDFLGFRHSAAGGGNGLYYGGRRVEIVVKHAMVHKAGFVL